MKQIHFLNILDQHKLYLLIDMIIVENSNYNYLIVIIVINEEI